MRSFFRLSSYRRILICFGVVLLFICHTAFGKPLKEYRGEATRNGRLIYVEHHRLTYDRSKKLLFAETIYKNPDGQTIVELKSDFRESLTAPSHTITDYRTGEVQGLKRENGSLILFTKNKDGKEATKLLKEESPERGLMVGCQGLNYYILENLDSIDAQAVLPVRFLIPGKLDYYDFQMRQVGQSERSLDFEIEVKNWFLALFAPTLEVKYDRVNKRILRYEGLSNIKDDKGKNQNVTIEYFYPED